MKQNVKVSIITVCYNSEKTIAQTIESVLNQTYPNIEYIIVDGGSTDGTVDVIRQYEQAFSGRLRWISEKDKGIYDAINKGIRHATGKLIGIISSNDWYEKDCIEKIIKSYDEAYPYQVIYGMERIIDNDKEYQIHFCHQNALKDGMMPHEACFVTRETYQKKGLYNLDYKIVSDYDYFLSLNEDSQVKFTPVYSIIDNFRLGGVSSSENMIYERFLVKYRHGDYSPKSYILYSIYFRIKNTMKKIIHL
jgi:glycosyltransferase involved in cell wall biosynthesis